MKGSGYSPTIDDVAEIAMDAKEELARLRAENAELRTENQRLVAVYQATQELLQSAVKALAGNS